jgi:hypothetical protein
MTQNLIMLNQQSLNVIILILSILLKLDFINNFESQFSFIQGN